MEQEHRRVIFLVGPTAGGKTAVGIALARRIGAEIISADSMQVYRGMEILSAQPTAEDMRGVAHHGIGVRGPAQEYNAALFREFALPVISAIQARGNVPLIVGGSGLYIDALRYGLAPDAGRNDAVRRSLAAQAQAEGSAAIYDLLREKDPAVAAAIHPHNVRRVIRALEACLSHAQPFSQVRAARQGLAATHRLRLFGLRRPRPELYARIDRRVEQMVAAGLVEEVRRLRSQALSATAAQALGVRQIGVYLDGQCALAEAVARLQQDTRHFAKRQLTWFRRDAQIEWLDVSAAMDADEIAARIAETLRAANDSAEASPGRPADSG
ncbi:MAG: tRNA (adenosine(37)-N6)-dimethylallyltransferase MiaA [Candidatus Omnitrophica bacterium]|nr:tRNA (adenosine(37)-N6)-dimethylallyltransferase MiaA [Candidatus Omnitrophota bacterium]